MQYRQFKQFWSARSAPNFYSSDHTDGINDDDLDIYGPSYVFDGIDNGEFYHKICIIK